MDKVREFVNSLNVDDVEQRELSHGIALYPDDSTKFADIYNMIALNKDFVQDSQQVTTSHTSFIYTDGEIEVALKADYDKDIYFVSFSDR